MSGRISRWAKLKMSFEQYFAERPFMVPEIYQWKSDDGEDSFRNYVLTPVQRFFVLLQEPSSCILATWISNFILLVILVNVICNVYMTMPSSRQYPVDSCIKPACENDTDLCPGTKICPPTIEPYLVRIDDICVIIFSIEYICRFCTVASVPERLANLVPPSWDEEEQFCARHEERDIELEPKQIWYNSLWSYFWQGKNLIDVVAIIPFYVTLADPNADASLSFIRVLRLFRIVRAFNMNANAGVTSLIIKTVTESMEVILLLLFFSAMIILIYGSIIFDVEMGTFTVDKLHRGGAYIRDDLEGNSELSPFTSALVGMYWAVITMTTVGYGDIYPVTPTGRILAITCAFVGVLFMALPISILGANFTVQYQRLSEVQRLERKKRQTLLLAKSLKTTSKKAINVDLDYEVTKSLVKEDKAKGVLPRASFTGSDGSTSPNALGGKKTLTGNRIADILVGERNQASLDREEYLRKYEMVPLKNDEDEDSNIPPPPPELTASVIPVTSSKSVHENGLNSPGGVDAANIATDIVQSAIMDCKTTEEKKLALNSMIQNMKIASKQIGMDLEDELQRTTARYHELTIAVDSMCSVFQEILDTPDIIEDITSAKK